jgi:uncharacterized membrane protein
MNDHKPHRTPRDGTADLLKGIAVLLMIQVHIMEQFATPELRETIIGKVSLFLGGPFCAPLFLAVMGYFLAAHGKPFLHALKRGLLLFAGGIALNVARSANLLIRIFSNETNLDPWSFIFGADILTLAGLSLILVALLRPLLTNNPFPWFLLSILTAAITPLMPATVSQHMPLNYLLAFFRGPFGWSYFPLFPWFAYVLAGYAFHLLSLRHGFFRKRDLTSLAIYLLPVMAGLTVTLPWAAGITSSLNSADGYYHHGILFYIWMIGWMAVYLPAVRMAEKNTGTNPVMKLVKWIGRKVTLLYIIQWLIIGNLATLLFGTQDLFRVLFWIPAVTALTLLAGWGYGWLSPTASVSRSRGG